MTLQSTSLPILATLGALYLGPCWFHPAVVQSFGETVTVRRASAAASAFLTVLLVAAIWAVVR